VSAFLFTLACIGSCGCRFGTWINPQDRCDNDRLVGLFRWQLCYYHRTSVAGATPPSLESLVGPFMPVIGMHGFESNLASYTVIAIPFWPLLIVGWPAFRGVVPAWSSQLRGATFGWCYAPNEQQRGFEPIVAARKAEPAAEPPGSVDPLNPRPPPSHAPASAPVAARR